MSEENAKPKHAYLLGLEVENLRCFGSPAEKLDLSDGNGRPRRWTILLGNNGTGKTTLLQLMALSSATRAIFDTGYDERTERLYSDTIADFNRHDVLSFGESIDVYRQAGATISHGHASASMLVSNRLEGPRPANGHVEKVETQWHPEWGMSEFKAAGKKEVRFPAMAYGCSRSLSASRRRGSDEYSSIGSIFNDHVRLLDSDTWLLNLSLSAGVRSNSHDPVMRTQSNAILKESIKLLCGALHQVKDIDFRPGEGPFSKPSVLYKTSDGLVRSDQLGHGNRGMIAWMVDFIARMTERYPDSPDPTKEPAVVLIDEIDLHLHPTWQRKIIPFLSEKFPNTQFVATAHSPLVLLGAGEDCNIAVLQREEGKNGEDARVRIINGMRPIPNARVDQLLTSDLFGLTSARSEEAEKKIARWGELTGKTKLSAAEKKELARLEREVPGLPLAETGADVDRMAELMERAEKLLSTPAPSASNGKKGTRHK